MSNTKETKKGLKRKFISLEDKIQILNRLEGGEKISSVAKSINLNESTIRTLKKNADNIRKTVADGCPLGAKRVARTRNSNMVKMERALMIWLEDCIAKNIPVSGNIIKQKALKIYEHLRSMGNSRPGLENHSFVASKGWFEKLKRRYTLHNIKFQGEQAPADAEAAENYKLELARVISEGGYSPDQIFNAHETALYWKKLPSTTFILNNQRRAQGFTFTVNHQGIREVVVDEETLDEEELMELIDAPTSNALVNENKEKEWVPNLDLKDVKKGLNLAKELELHFIETDRSTVRSGKFKRELRNCLAPYREVLVELEKKARIENQCKEEPSEEDILPIKRRRGKKRIKRRDSYVTARMSVEK